MMKKQITILGLLFVSLIQAQNVFLNRDFWETNPTITDIEQKISEGNSATELNRYGFDATVYALLENADTKVIKHLLAKKGNGVNKLTHDGRTYIFWAAYKNNVPIVKYLLKNGAKTNIIDNKGYSLLNFTAVAGVKNTNLYDLLIANGANPITEKTPSGANAMLLIISKLKDFEMVDYFTKKGLSINTTDNDGNGVFNYTAQSANKKMLQKIIEKGLPYKNLNKKGGNAMLFATRGSRKGYNSLDYFKYLEKLGINPNVKNIDGRTPLHNLSYRNNDIATLQYFIDKGVDVNQVDNEGNTALLNASSRNSFDVIKLFAAKTANINHVNKDGHSALTRAMRNSPEIVRFFIEKGVKPTIIDNKGNNMTYYLIKSYDSKKKEDFKSKLEMLTKAGLAFSKNQKDGSNAYHIAIDKNDTALLNMLKNFKIDINAKDNSGITPLHKAIMTAKDDKIVKYLIANGANKNIKTDMDESVYDLASENELLKKNNIDISFLK